MIVNSLPSQPTSFVGREAELAQIADLLANPACRLLTLTGPGGMGKTRLALEAAQQSVFPSAVYFVPLQPLTSADFIVSTIADTVGLQLSPGIDPKQQLLNYLREKSLLLVLDNFEHLLEGADVLVDILAAAPQVKMLVTSRERLRLREEWVFIVAGLTFPQDGYTVEPDDYSATQLFMQHARRASYKPTASDTASIVRICQMLEGLPLAIELAAAWTRVMPCTEIEREIVGSLDILTTTTRNVPEKHRSMRATFDYSWALLAEDERTVFGKLALFRGGFTREAAEQVAGASLAVLVLLVDRSLLRVDSTGRYSLQELLRQYADDQLQRAGEAEAAQDAHCIYYARFLQRFEPDLKGPQQARALDDIAAELDNVRVSWRRAVTQGMEGEIRQSLGSLARFLIMRNYFAEGTETFDIAIARFGGQESELLAQLVMLQPYFYQYQMMLDKAFEASQKGLTLMQHRDVYLPMPIGLSRLPYFMDQLGGFETIQGFYQDYLSAARRRGDDWDVAWTLYCMGVLAEIVGHYREVQAFQQESLTLFRAIGDKWASGWPMGGLISMARRQKDYANVRRYHLEHLAVSREVGDRAGILFSLQYLGDMAVELGELEHSKQFFGQSLPFIAEIGWNIHTKQILESIARYLMAEGTELELAVEVLMLAFPQSGVALPPYHSDVSQQLETLQRKLPPDVFAAAVQRGQRNNLEGIVATLLKRFSPPDEQQAAVPNGSHLPDQHPTHSLTERELEILRLLADGLNSREIADQLVLSVGTVRWYLKQIYSKLDAHSRSEAITRAKGLNLLT